MKLERWWHKVRMNQVKSFYFVFLFFKRLGESRKLTSVLFWIGCSSCSPMNSPAIMQTLPVKLGILVQFFIFFGIIASTVTITRSVVQGSLLRINANLEQFQKAAGAPQPSECGGKPKLAQIWWWFEFKLHRISPFMSTCAWNLPWLHHQRDCCQWHSSWWSDQELHEFMSMC